VTRARRPSAQTAAVLRALAEDPGRWRYGYDLCTQLGIRAGSMYPILIRLADRGLLETSWETGQAPGRPARHLYRLTGTGRAYAGAAAAATPAKPI
jgi:DNA-binding PadR family transcriptional regulator